VNCHQLNQFFSAWNADNAIIDQERRRGQVHQGRQQFGWARAGETLVSQKWDPAKTENQRKKNSLAQRTPNLLGSSNKQHSNIQALAVGSGRSGSSAGVQGSDGGATSAEVDGRQARGGLADGHYVQYARPENTYCIGINSHWYKFSLVQILAGTNCYFWKFHKT
jgi:hypothetical protein